MNFPATIDLDELIPTRQSLLSRLKNWEDNESWREFFQTYWKLIYTTARRAGLSDAQAQEVVQETIIKVCHHMPGFRYDPARGAFKAWLLQMTRWRILAQQRKLQRDAVFLCEPEHGPHGEDFLEDLPDPVEPALGRVWEEEWERNLFDAALQRIKTRVNPKQYQIFDLHVLKNWPSKRVCATLEVSATQVYLAKFRLTALLKREVKALETEFNPRP